MDDATRIAAPSIPLRLSDDLTVRLKFTMLAAAACEAKYGAANPLRALLEPGVTEPLLFTLAAGCLHPGSGLDVRTDKIISGETTALEEAERVARIIMVSMDNMDGQAARQAVAEAADIAAPLGKCVASEPADCGHGFSQHTFMGPCRVEGCACPGYRLITEADERAAAEKAREADAAEEPAGKVPAPGMSDGATSTTSPRLSSDALLVTSGS